MPSDTVYLGESASEESSCGARAFFSLPTHWISATGLSIFVCARAHKKGELPADLCEASASRYSCALCGRASVTVTLGAALPVVASGAGGV